MAHEKLFSSEAFYAINITGYNQFVISVSTSQLPSARLTDYPERSVFALLR